MSTIYSCPGPFLVFISMFVSMFMFMSMFKFKFKFVFMFAFIKFAWRRQRCGGRHTKNWKIGFLVTESVADLWPQKLWQIIDNRSLPYVRIYPSSLQRSTTKAPTKFCTGTFPKYFNTAGAESSCTPVSLKDFSPSGGIEDCYAVE
jgi:hypothetical protein